MLWLSPLTFDPSVPELRPDAALHANGLHGLLRLPLGLLPLLLPAERRRHGCRGTGLRHGPSQDPGGDARGPTGAQKATNAAEQLRTIATHELSHTHTTAGGEKHGQKVKFSTTGLLKTSLKKWVRVAGGGCRHTPGEALGSPVIWHHMTRAFLSVSTVPDKQLQTGQQT